MHAKIYKATLRDLPELIDVETATFDDEKFKEQIGTAIANNSCYKAIQMGFIAGFAIVHKNMVTLLAVHPLFKDDNIQKELLDFVYSKSLFENGMHICNETEMKNKEINWQSEYDLAVDTKYKDENPDYILNLLDNEVDIMEQKEVNVIIRRASLRDLCSIAKVEERVFGDNRKRDSIESSVADGNCLVAVINGKLGGFVTFHRNVTESHFIELIAVTPAFRRVGVASTLLKEVEEYCSCKKIQSTTSAINKAMQNTFEKNGYKVEEKIMQRLKNSSDILYYKFVK